MNLKICSYTLRKLKKKLTPLDLHTLRLTGLYPTVTDFYPATVTDFHPPPPRAAAQLIPPHTTPLDLHDAPDSPTSLATSQRSLTSTQQRSNSSCTPPHLIRSIHPIHPLHLVNFSTVTDFHPSSIPSPHSIRSIHPIHPDSSSRWIQRTQTRASLSSAHFQLCTLIVGGLQRPPGGARADIN